MSPASLSPGTPSRLRFEARPLTLRPGTIADPEAAYGVYLIHRDGRERCLAYGDRARMEGIAARLQDQEDDRHRPAPG
jgi:hypothetical protein